jgi:restriction endonuclease S subunit
MIKRGKSHQYGFSDIQIIKSGQIRGLYNFDFSKKHYISQKFVLDERKLEKGDILINSTGVGTAGRVNLFNLDGKFLVDSHVTIVRLNKKIVLPKFVLYQLWNLGFHNIEKMANGQSGQIELSKEAIENILIPIRPLSEQQDIISQIEPFEKEIEEAKQFLANSIELKQELLAKYL